MGAELADYLTLCMFLFVAAHRSAISCNKCYVAATLLRLVQLVLRDKVVRNKKDTQGGKHRSP